MSAAFYFRADQPGAVPVYLVEIALAAYGGNGAITLRLASQPFTHPSGTHWDVALAGLRQLDAGGDWLRNSWQQADFEFGILDVHLTPQTAVDDTAFDLLTDYEIVGSVVTAYATVHEAAAAADVNTIFTGIIEEVLEIGHKQFWVRCVQDDSWNVKMPPRDLKADDFPRAPTSSVGTPLPIVIGDFESNRIKDTVSGFSLHAGAMARGAIPLVNIDPGTDTGAGGSGHPKYLVSDREMKSVAHDPAHNLFLYEAPLGSFTASTDTTFSNPAGGPCTMEMADRLFSGHVLGIENHADTTADNWESMIREGRNNEPWLKSRMDYTNNKKIIRLKLPDIAPLGDFVAAFVLVWYDDNHAGAGAYGTFGLKGNGVDTVDDLSGQFIGSAGASLVGYPTKQANTDVTGTLGAVPRWELIKYCWLYAEINTGGAANEITDLFNIVLLVAYRPSARIVSRGFTIYEQGHVNQPETWYDPSYSGGSMRPVTYGGVSNFDVPMFCFGKGVPDDGSGTYTGTAAALIEHPTDVVKWMGIDMGGLVAGDFAATTDLGSFATAKTDLSGYKIVGLISRAADMESYWREIGDQVLCWFYRRHSTGKVVAFPWLTTRTANWRTTSDIYEFSRDGNRVADGTFQASLDRQMVRNVIRVNYDYDHRTKSYKKHCFISDTDSGKYASGVFSRDQNAGAPENRETLAAASVAQYGARELVHNLTWVSDDATATNIRNRLFDLHYLPRVRVQFEATFPSILIERGHVFRCGADWDAFVPYPLPGSNGSWDGKKFQCVSVTRRAGTATRVLVVGYQV